MMTAGSPSPTARSTAEMEMADKETAEKETAEVTGEMSTVIWARG
jgi:hypothetical protein